MPPPELRQALQCPLKAAIPGSQPRLAEAMLPEEPIVHQRQGTRQHVVAVQLAAAIAADPLQVARNHLHPVASGALCKPPSRLPLSLLLQLPLLPLAECHWH